MAVSSSLDKPIRLILKRWSKMGCYCYIRPITSKYIDARSEMSQYWTVQVELRATPPGRWDGEGYNLDAIILELDQKVPRSRKEHREKNAGWLMPESVLQKEVARAKESIKQAKLDRKQGTSPAKTKTRVKSKGKSERPRKRPKR